MNDKAIEIHSHPPAGEEGAADPADTAPVGPVLDVLVARKGFGYEILGEAWCKWDQCIPGHAVVAKQEGFPILGGGWHYGDFIGPVYLDLDQCACSPHGSGPVLEEGETSLFGHSRWCLKPVPQWSTDPERCLEVEERFMELAPQGDFHLEHLGDGGKNHDWCCGAFCHMPDPESWGYGETRMEAVCRALLKLVNWLDKLPG